MRSSGDVEREQFEQLESALDALDARVLGLAGSAPKRPVDLRFKKIEPVQQVFARLELAGPERLLASVHVGIDIHGDGSAEPYLGRLRRREIDQRPGESAVDALRRTLAS